MPPSSDLLRRNRTKGMQWRSQAARGRAIPAYNCEAPAPQTLDSNNIPRDGQDAFSDFFWRMTDESDYACAIGRGAVACGVQWLARCRTRRAARFPPVSRRQG